MGKIYNYTRNEWGTRQVATAHKEIKFLQRLNSADPEDKMHVVRMKRVKKITPNKWERFKITLETSGKNVKIFSNRVGSVNIHSKRV